MDLENQLRTQQLKRKLEARKEDRVKQKMREIQKSKVNLDQSHFKTGKIEKTKFIEKKKYETEYQKARKIQVQIQDNANPSTYIGQSQEYINILNRTKNYVKFDQNKLRESCRAIVAYAQAHKETVVTLQLTMENEIECNETPVLLKLVHPETDVDCIVLTGKQGQMEANAISEADMKIMNIKEFLEQSRKDKNFRKSMVSRLTRIFCDFNIFTRSKAVKKLMGQNRPVFPIDLRKVPYSIKSVIPDYRQYLQYLLGASFAIARSGKQHRVRLRVKQASEMADNIEIVSQQMVARLIQKNKKKGNRLVCARLKTDSSIPIDIYE